MILIPRIADNPQWYDALKKSRLRNFDGVDELQTFTPMYGYGLEGEIVQNMYSALFPKVGNRGAKGRRQALQSALLCLAQSVLNTTGAAVCGFTHKRTTKRVGTLKRYKNNSFSGSLFTEALDSLASLGYVKCEKGFKGEDAAFGLVTLWLVDVSFGDWVTEHLSKLSVICFEANPETLRLKVNSKLTDYDDDDHTRSIRQRLEQSNKQRLHHQWTYVPVARVYWELEGDKKVYRQYVLDDARSQLTTAHLSCSRVFADKDFKAGGRFYCNAQRLTKAERATITIDGVTTIELDFKSLHPRLLYHSEGHEAPMDCYASNKRSRSLTKSISLFSINCDSRKQAKATLRTKCKLTADEAEHHLQEYIEEHPKIAHRFFKSSWKQLQYLDSQL